MTTLKQKFQKFNEAWTRNSIPVLIFLFLILAGFVVAQTYASQAGDDKQDKTINALSTALTKQQQEAQNGGNRIVTPAPSQIIQDPQVIQGANGSNGSNGVNGLQGLTGKTGKTGAMGLPGLPGKSPDCLLESTMCRGVQGDKGDKGDKGDTGEKGDTGSAGEMGPRGRGISKTEVVNDGQGTCTLMITYTDDTTQNAGSWACAAQVIPSPSPSDGILILTIGLARARRFRTDVAELEYLLL